MLPQSQLPKCHLTPIPHGLRRALRSLADFDHIVDSDEMIVHPLATVETGGAGFVDDRLEMAVVHIAEHGGQNCDWIRIHCPPGWCGGGSC